MKSLFGNFTRNLEEISCGRMVTCLQLRHNDVIPGLFSVYEHGKTTLQPL